MAGGGLYDVLGVDAEATTAEIRRAFRAVARTCHPDLAGHDEAKAHRFAAARNAYEVLTNPARRTEHDRALLAGADGAGQGEVFEAFWARAGGRSSGRRGFADFEDREAPSRPGVGNRAPRGDDVELDVDVPARVALTGGRVPVRYMRVRRSEGWTRDDPSTGLEPSTERRELEVPAKVRSFQTRRYPGLGDAGAYGGPHGDLVVRFRVVDDPVEAEAVERVVEIGVTEALLGVTLPLATPQGRVRLVVPPCTSSGARLRLRGKGAGPGRPERDLLVEVRIVVPDALDSDTEALVRRLADRLAPPRRED